MVPGTYFHKYEFTKKSGSNYTEETTTGDNGGDTTVQTVTFGLAEPDDKYEILISSYWAATWYISARSASGFAITFSVGPAAGSTFGWMIVRVT